MRLLDLFAENCRQHPETVFYSDAPVQGDYTFAYVDECAAKVYAALADRGIGAEDVVAVRLPRSGRIPIALIGIMRAGAAFVVIGDRSTPETADFILRDTAPKLVIDPAVYAQMMTGVPREGYREPSDHDLAAIIYSSGSSGFFKGCMHEYGVYDGIVERTLSVNVGYASMLPDERCSLTLGFYSASAVFQFCYSMISGEYLDIVPYAVMEDAPALEQRVREQRITEVTLAPKHIQSMDLAHIPSLRYVYSMYEMFSGTYLEKPVLVNCYGMTESAMALTYFGVDRPYDVTPVGKPYFDITAKLVDDRGAEVKTGEIGELWYRSLYFRGYKNRPDLTAQVLQDGWYHTGDIGKFREDGVLVILGRKIDVRRTPQGWVVPFEIALAAKKALGLTWAYVKLFGEKTVCLYYCDDVSLTTETVREALREQLPAYALPTHCMKIRKIPYFPSGKVDRTAFPEPEV